MSRTSARFLPKLRHRRWIGWTEAACRPLFRNLLSPTVPHVGFGDDSDQQFRFATRASLAALGLDLAAAERCAVENLARRAPQWKVGRSEGGWFGLGRRPTLLHLIDEFASEQLLNPAFLAEAHRLLRSSQIACGMPVRGVLIAVADERQTLRGWVEMIESGFVHSPDPMEPLSPAVILVHDGRPSGVVGRRPDLVPDAGFPWPTLQLETAALHTPPTVDEGHHVLHPVGYHAESHVVHFTCMLRPDQGIAPAELAQVEALVRTGRTALGEPVSAVHVHFPEAEMAGRAGAPLKVVGAKVFYPDATGDDVPA